MRKQVLDALIQVTFNAELRDELNELGLTGTSSNVMLQNFRELQKEGKEHQEALGDLLDELRRLDEQINVIFSGTGEQKFYQLDPDIPKLTVRHNLTAQNLLFSDDLGGLAVPSLAVLPEGQPMKGFGEITLIGNEDLGDPANLPIFDADGYTVRFPSPEYSKAKAADLDPIIKELVIWERVMQDGLGDASYYVERHMRDHPNPQLVVWKLLDSPAAQAWFLSQMHAEHLQPSTRDIKPGFRWSWDDELVEFFANAPSPETWVWEDPKRHKLLMDAAAVVRKVAVRSLMERDRTNKIKYTKEEAESVFESGAFINRDGALSETRFRELQADAAQKGAQEIDQLSTQDMLNARLDEGTRRAEFKAWVEAKVVPAMGEAHLKISGKKVPYNLENIVRKMTGKLRGAEFMDNMMNEGMMRALASHRFKRLEEMRARSEVAIAEPAEVEILREAAQAKMLAFSSQMSQFYTIADHTGFVDAYAAADAARRGIVKWATQYKMGTADDMHDAMVSEGFDEIPDWMIDEGMMAAMDWLAVPVPYFEAKPQRAVKLEEFSGAVIPSDASADTRAVLQKRGVPFKEYQVGQNIDEAQTRTDAVNEFTQTLANQGERTLYQSELGLTSGLLTGARTMPRESGSAKEMLNSLKKQPNVKEAEIDAVGVHEWAEGMGEFTRDQLIEFIDQGGVQVEETFYAGRPNPNYVPNFDEASINAWDEIFDSREDVQMAMDSGYQIYDVTDRAESDLFFRAHIDLDAGQVSVETDESYIKDDGKIGTRQKWLESELPNNVDPTQSNLMLQVDQAINDYIDERGRVPGAAGRTKWTDWTLPSDRQSELNDREILLTVPQVGGYNYTLENLKETEHPDDPAKSKAEIARMEERFWYIDAFSPLPDAEGATQTQRVQLFQLRKDDFHTLDEAMQYIVESKPVEPGIGENFTSHAFKEKNIISWARVTDRVGPNGEKIFFIEEVQSDLHQAGLTDGYQYTEAQEDRARKALSDIELKARDMLGKMLVPFAGYWTASEALQEFRMNEGKPPKGNFPDPFKDATKKQRALMNRWLDAYNKNETIQAGGRTPNMPFKGDAWAELAMKRMIRLAVEGGYDQIAWTTGVQQLERYDIEEYFSKIEWDPRDEQLVTYDPDGRMIESRHYTYDELDGVIGAERVLEIQRQMDRAENRYDIVSTTALDIESDDQFIGDIEREWMEKGGEIYGLVDENGQILRQSGGDYHMAEFIEGAEDIKQDMIYANNIPTLTNLEITDEEGSGLRKRYDDLMVNVTNRALRKIDKGTSVKREGIRMEGGVPPFRMTVEGDGDTWYVEGVPANQPSDSDRVQLSPRFKTTEEAYAWRDFRGEFGMANIQHGFDISPEIQVAAMEGQTLFQDRERGSITFNAERGAIIRLTKAKDLSTFLHEMGHLYFEMMADLAEMPDANAGIIDDYTKMLNYLGINHRREVTRDHHELLARSFEAYLREGKAPTAELQPLFSTIKGWMLRVYSEITKLLGPGEELTDDIRGVFDRMLASDQAISQSEDMMAYVQLYQNAEEMGVSPEVFEVYRRNNQIAHDAEVDKLSQKMIKSMTWAQQQWWKDELKKVAVDVRAEAEAMPVYKALAMLQRGKLPDGSEPTINPFKLSKASALEAVKGSQSFLNRLPGRGKSSVYTLKEDGVGVDWAATFFGFENGKELLANMLVAPHMEAWIKAESNRIMEENHPNPLNSPEMIDDATKAVHSEKRGQIIRAELKALHAQQAADAKIVKATKDTAKREEREAREANKGQLPKRENMAAIKAAAAEIIAAKKMRNINPNSYLQAEKKAGRLAFEAMAKKDYAEAYLQKRKQIMNFEAYRAAVKAKTQNARDIKYLQKFEKTKKRNRLRERMGKAGKLEQIDAILEGIDLANKTLSTIDRERIEGELMASIEAGEIITTPDVIATLKRSAGTNWKDLTFEELSGIRDVVKQLEHQARTDLKAIINGEEVIIQEAVDAVASSIIENNVKVPIGRAEETGTTKAKRNVREGVGHWLRSSSIARVLDKAGFGAVTKHVIVPIRRAYVEKLIPAQQQAAEDIAAIYQEHYSNAELVELGKPLDDTTMGEEMSKADILALALNWGAESNRQAVLGGMMEDEFGNKTPAFTEQGIAEALGKMDARDWEFVQSVWRFEDSYYEQMAETEKRRRGIAPEKIEGMTFEIRTVDGEIITVEGGYHPLQYDSRHGGRMSESEFQDYYNKMINGTYLSSSTRAGSTHERVKNHGKVVRLSLNTIDHNIRELTRDLALGDEINLVNRILTSKEVGNAARNTNSAEALKELQLWLSDAAVGELPAQTVVEKALSWTRVGFTKSKLAFNVYVTALQLTGIFQSMAVIGSGAYMKGAGKFLSNPVDNYKMVMETSAFMKARYGTLQTWDKDVTDTNAYLKSMFGPAPTRLKTGFDKMGHYYFYPIAKMQSVVDVTTWMGAYEAALNDPNVKNEQEAIYAADSMVENSQTSGLFSDRSGLERGTLGTRTRQGQFVRLWTTLISYMLAKGNIAYEKGSRTDFKNPAQVVQFATDMMLLFMMEGIASSLLYDRWPGDEDEDETIVGWTAKVTVDSILSGIPLIREYSAAKYGSGNTPVGALVNDAYKFVQQSEQGEADEAWVKAGVKVTGTLLHLPASQTNRAVEALFKDDAEWYEYVLGDREK